MDSITSVAKPELVTKTSSLWSLHILTGRGASGYEIGSSGLLHHFISLPFSLLWNLFFKSGLIHFLFMCFGSTQWSKEK